MTIAPTVLSLVSMGSCADSNGAMEVDPNATATSSEPAGATESPKPLLDTLLEAE